MTTEQQAFDMVIALHRLLRTLRHAVRDTTLQPTQVLVLAQLVTSGPMRVGELAARVPCSQPTATVAVAGLETAGYVRRVPDPADGRAIQVGVTDEGRQMMLSLAHGEAHELAERMNQLDPADQDQIHQTVALLAKLAQP
ncbi:MarR family winged helix-turn-helix transcriptional regulator [Actinosynnema sp. ALI-1.44]|uniref:MarR family winged helix-turn-helix transcriptional regulator n=1 Tax=Actinosynnema sp. ALI-1.44 TaxID=1933779 RepID=UPI001EDA7D65|nr:MarR family transcriptional regulator [Actinosynnema sp. ALI-1.44]